MLGLAALVRSRRSPGIALVGGEPPTRIAPNEPLARACIDPLPLAIHDPALLCVPPSAACRHRSRPPDTRRAHAHGGGIASGWRSRHTYHPSVHRARLLLATIALASTLGACGFIGGTVVQDGPPVPAGQLGPVFPGEGGAPAFECRGVPLEQCRGFASQDQPNVVRVIVTCTAACTPEQGQVRIDVLLPDGSTRSIGEGAYESAQGQAPMEPTTW
jgi:hypothetical protein